MFPLSLSDGYDLANYIKKIESFPILKSSQEQELVKKWCDEKDVKAAHTLVVSHLRLVVKIAMQYRNYGIALMDLISEGNVGLMKAIRNFNPEYETKVATYATWWIKSSIKEFVLKSWSIVKIGSTVAQRKLFFNLRKLKNKIVSSMKIGEDRSTVLEQVATDLNLPIKEVIAMDLMMCTKDASLNERINDDTDLHEIIAATDCDVESLFIKHVDSNKKREIFYEALEKLSIKPEYISIFIKRKLSKEKITLSDLSKEYNLSGERIRQIEIGVMKKVSDYCIKKLGKSV